MNHPTPEELTGYLYEELAHTQQITISEHLVACAECRAQLETWRALRRNLGTWKVNDHSMHATKAGAGSAFRWAAAALLLLCVGFALARFTTPTPKLDAAAIRSGLADELRQELRAELGRFSADQSQRQTEYQTAITKALGRIEAQRLVDYATLRKDVETVAVQAEDELNSTRQDLIRLAVQR